MRIGLALPHYDFSFPDGAPATTERVVAYARGAEEAGFDSVWVSDHLFLEIERYGGPPGRHATPEALTMMAALAGATERVRIGSLVLCAAFRNPAVLAQSARSLHDASGGRIELGLGAGWYEPEFVEAGLAFGTPGSRIAHLREVLARVRELAPDGPPLWIGGKGGPKIMRAVAELADGWNVVWQMTPERYAERVSVLRDACSAAGRDPTTVRRSVGLSTLIGTDPEDLATRYARLQAWAPGGALDGIDLRTWAQGRLVGTPKECAATIQALADQGVGEIIVAPANLPFSVYDDEQLELLATELFPLVR